MDLLSTLVLLSVLGLVTSCITAMVGMGGGLLLLAALPGILPANVIIPVHGTVQLSSNFSRWVFGVKHTCVKPLLFFLVGSIVGTLFGAKLLQYIDVAIIPVTTSVFILFILWTPISSILKKIPGRYASLGAVQTSMSLYVGATGPLSTSLLFKEGYHPDQVVVTNAAVNTVVNVAKIIVFTSLGFVFKDYLPHILVTSVFAVAGSYVGTHFRDKVNDDLARMALKVVISILCLKNIIYFLWKIFF
ncbi:sulfite exporter TauE/SafE family protein [Halomonas sp. SpR8]|uniref:sulfite exporter TauE/SafE family protein n=1 Tax=Halomonas sp. SpR8 TaxID=3050463 RepID=UPI0027E3CA2C|nr:sulfite exporter TauE/SafE family protein [Halomonas sp. SpR8]MDQ7730604.1 sulfite exporter TauE/SafE family protein [Halomonas sp. SpR8]